MAAATEARGSCMEQLVVRFGQVDQVAEACLRFNAGASEVRETSDDD